MAQAALKTKDEDATSKLHNLARAELERAHGSITKAVARVMKVILAADKHAVVQFSAATANAGAKAHDGVAVNAGQALDGANRHALSEGSDDLNLLVAVKVVHDGSSPHVVDETRDPGKAAPTALCVPERSFASGPCPGW